MRESRGYGIKHDMIRLQSNGFGWGVRALLAALAVWVAVADSEVTSVSNPAGEVVRSPAASVRPAVVRWTTTDFAALAMMVLGAAVPFVPLGRREPQKKSGANSQASSVSPSVAHSLPSPPARLGRFHSLPSCDWTVRPGVDLNRRPDLGMGTRSVRG